MNNFSTKELVDRLVGQIRPSGESNFDAIYKENLIQYCELIESMLSDIHQLTPCSNYEQDSIKDIGNYAKKFLKSVRDEINIE